jgi:hypothetical protein
LWPDDDRVLLEEELRGVSWLATLAPLLAETSSAGLAELLTGIPSSKGRGTSGGDVQRIRAQFTPARQTQRKKLKIGLLQILCGEQMAHACVGDDIPFHTNVSPFVRKHSCQTRFFASETEYISSIRE